MCAPTTVGNRSASDEWRTMSERPVLSVSVVLCTRNRGDALKLALEALVRMSVPEHLSWEVIVVDNASSDHTAEVIASFSSQLPLRSVYHATPGQGEARNAGWYTAKSDIIAWTDDDCIVDVNWLATIVSTFSADQMLAGIGGRVELFDAADLPLTIQRSRVPARLGEGRRFSRDDLFMIPGCNMAFRASIHRAVGAFDRRLGPGTPARSADDTDFLYRTLRAGQTLAYVPELLVYHNHGRRTVQSAEQLARGYAIGRGAFFAKHIAKGDAYVWKMLAQEVTRSVRPMLQVVRRQTKWLVYVLEGAVLRFGGR